MVLFRILVLLLLLASGVSFALYAITGRPHYKRWGLRVLKWTVVGALGFFAVLAFQRFR